KGAVGMSQKPQNSPGRFERTALSVLSIIMLHIPERLCLLDFGPLKDLKHILCYGGDGACP
ncbi:MAG: hypothetical protein R6V46_12520, partial [Desulfatiglandaceae bacterium]